MFLGSRLDPADPLLHVSCHAGRLSFPLSSFSARCCCFSCCWRLKWFLVWLTIWLLGQHTQMICMRASVCCQPGPAGPSRALLSAAVRRLDVCPLICARGKRKVPALNLVTLLVFSSAGIGDLVPSEPVCWYHPLWMMSGCGTFHYVLSETSTQSVVSFSLCRMIKFWLYFLLSST